MWPGVGKLPKPNWHEYPQWKPTKLSTLVEPTPYSSSCWFCKTFSSWLDRFARAVWTLFVQLLLVRVQLLIVAARCPWARKAVPYPRGRGDVPSGMFSLYPWREKETKKTKKMIEKGRQAHGRGDSAPTSMRRGPPGAGPRLASSRKERAMIPSPGRVHPIFFRRWIMDGCGAGTLLRICSAIESSSSEAKWRSGDGQDGRAVRSVSVCGHARVVYVRARPTANHHPNLPKAHQTND